MKVEFLAIGGVSHELGCPPFSSSKGRWLDQIMAKIVNVHEAKSRLSRQLDKAHAGSEIIFDKAGKPYARLMLLAASPAGRQPGRLRGRLGVGFFEPLPAEDLGAWESH